MLRFEINNSVVAKFQLSFAWLCGLLLILSACSSTQPTNDSLPRQRAYILSGQGEYNDFRHNALTIVDTEIWQIYKSIPLPHSRAAAFSQDPQGRLWIGFSGNGDSGDHRVQVYSPKGDLLTTMNTCSNPEAGIHFVGEYAFVVCTENGFSGRVDVVNLQTFKSEKLIDLNIPTSDVHLLISSTANKAHVVVFGFGDKGGFLSLLDPHSLAVSQQIGPLEYTDIWTMLPYQQKFYLLNVKSAVAPHEQARDILVLQPDASPKLSDQTLPVPSPFLGVIHTDQLYLYHNPTWNSTDMNPQRSISRLDLQSGKAEHWQLPDQWNATGINVINGQIILANWWLNESTRDGLYLFDPATGQLTQKINIPGAEQIMVGE